MLSAWSIDGAPGDTVEIANTAPLNPAYAFSLPTHAPSDFNGDGFSDILFTDGQQTLATWQLSAAQVVKGGGVLGNPGPAQSVVATGDTTGQGYASVFFFDAQTGAISQWTMFGVSVTGAFILGVPGGTWRVVGTGDFNGDGDADLVFRDNAGDLAIWELSAHVVISGGQIGNPGAALTLVGEGDFNGDGKTDLLFENANGTYAHLVDERRRDHRRPAEALHPGAGWVYEGAGDFNGDGTSDLLFYNVDTGAYSVSIIVRTARSRAAVNSAPTRAMSFSSRSATTTATGDSDSCSRTSSPAITSLGWCNDTTIIAAVDYGTAGPAFGASSPQRRRRGRSFRRSRFSRTPAAVVQAWSSAGNAGGADGFAALPARADPARRSATSSATISPICCSKAPRAT